MAARIPSLLAGSLLVVLVFLWTRVHAGQLAAWIAALLLCLSPISIYASTFARFYAIHGLLFWLAAVGVFALTETPMSRLGRAALASAIGLCLLLALHLQPLTVVGAGGLALWLVVAVGLPWLGAQRHDPRQFRLLIAAIVLGMIVSAVVLIESGIVHTLFTILRNTPVHSQPVSNQVWFYHLHLIENYPSFWPLLPFMALVALAAKPRPSLFSLCVFLPGVGVLSIGAMKHTDYIYFLLPFLFVTWGIALAQAWPFLRRCVIAVTDRAILQVAPAAAGRAARYGLIAAGILFLLLSSGGPTRTLLKPFGVALGENERATDWASARELLGPWLRSAGVILTANDTFALYYLGDYDFAVNASRLSETSSGEEFARDSRTGRPVVSTPASLERIIQCYPSGLILTDIFNWRVWRAITDPTADLIITRTEPIELPARLRLRAFYWKHQDSAGLSPDCAALPRAPRPAS